MNNRKASPKAPAIKPGTYTTTAVRGIYKGAGALRNLLPPQAAEFTEMLPQILRNLLPPQAAEFTAVSKYVLCYEKTRYMNGFEYWYDTQGRMIR